MHSFCRQYPNARQPLKKFNNNTTQIANDDNQQQRQQQELSTSNTLLLDPNDGRTDEERILATQQYFDLNEFNGLNHEQRLLKTTLMMKNLTQFLAKKSEKFMGFQISQAEKYSSRLSPFLDIHVNNIGDSYSDVGGFRISTKLAERAVLKYLSEMWIGPPDHIDNPSSYSSLHHNELVHQHSNLINNVQKIPQQQQNNNNNPTKVQIHLDFNPRPQPSTIDFIRFAPNYEDNMNAAFFHSSCGFVNTMGSTEGNLYGIRQARDYLRGKFLSHKLYVDLNDNDAPSPPISTTTTPHPSKLKQSEQNLQLRGQYIESAGGDSCTEIPLDTTNTPPSLFSQSSSSYYPTSIYDTHQQFDHQCFDPSQHNDTNHGNNNNNNQNAHLIHHHQRPHHHRPVQSLIRIEKSASIQPNQQQGGTKPFDEIQSVRHIHNNQQQHYDHIHTDDDKYIHHELQHHYSEFDKHYLQHGVKPLLPSNIEHISDYLHNEPILLFSRDAHYSIPKMKDLLEIHSPASFMSLHYPSASPIDCLMLINDDKHTKIMKDMYQQQQQKKQPEQQNEQQKQSYIGIDELLLAPVTVEEIELLFPHNKWPERIPTYEDGTFNLRALFLITRFFFSIGNPLIFVCNLGITVHGCYDSPLHIYQMIYSTPGVHHEKEDIFTSPPSQSSSTTDQTPTITTNATSSSSLSSSPTTTVQYLHITRRNYYIHVDGALGASYTYFFDSYNK